MVRQFGTSTQYIEQEYNLMLEHWTMLSDTTVFQTRDGSRVKNLTATATWPDMDENDNKLRYSYKVLYLVRPA